MRVATQFKQYSQNITYLYVNQFKKAFAGASPEEKAEAKRTLIGMRSLQFAVAGSLGLPMAIVITSMVQALSDWDDDDPRDLKAEYRQFLSDNLGKTGGQIVAKGFLDALTPFSIHGRLTMSDLWIRTSDRELTGANQQMDIIKGILGPQASIFIGFMRGFETMADGNVERGIEQMTPKFFKNPMQAARYMAEDAKTFNGLELKDMNPGEIFGKLIGFSSSALGDKYDQTNTIRNLDTRRGKRRGHLLDMAVQAYDNQDKAEIAEARANILKWNKQNPQHPIGLRNIIQARKGRGRIEQQSTFGVRKTRRNKDLIDTYDFAN